MIKKHKNQRCSHTGGESGAVANMACNSCWDKAVGTADIVVEEVGAETAGLVAGIGAETSGLVVGIGAATAGLVVADGAGRELPASVILRRLAVEPKHKNMKTHLDIEELTNKKTYDLKK